MQQQSFHLFLIHHFAILLLLILLLVQVILESPVPREELVEVELQNDVLRIDGNFAVAWSKGLNFTVEKSTKSLIGSAVSGEGLVNVYRGTGKVLMAPVRNLTTASATSISR